MIMEHCRPVQYIKVGACNETIINEAYIRWVKKMNECLEVCTRTLGCDGNGDTHSICKSNNLESYNKLNKHFE
jgi:hypothetical protein